MTEDLEIATAPRRGRRSLLEQAVASATAELIADTGAKRALIYLRVSSRGRLRPTTTARASRCRPNVRLVGARLRVLARL